MSGIVNDQAKPEDSEDIVADVAIEQGEDAKEKKKKKKKKKKKIRPAQRMKARSNLKTLKTSRAATLYVLLLPLQMVIKSQQRMLKCLVDLHFM